MGAGSNSRRIAALALASTTGCALLDGVGGGDSADAGGAGSPDARGSECLAGDVDAGGLDGAPARLLTDESILLFKEIGESKDYFGLQLRPDAAPFTGAVEVGLYRAEDSATNYETCGICVIILADVLEGARFPRQVFVADSASVNIESISDSFIKGTVSPSTLVGFDVSDTGVVAGAPNGCRVEAGQTSFETNIVPE